MFSVVLLSLFPWGLSVSVPSPLLQQYPSFSPLQYSQTPLQSPLTTLQSPLSPLQHSIYSPLFNRNIPLQPLVWTIQPQQQVARLGSSNPYQPTSLLPQQSAVQSNLEKQSAVSSHLERQSAVPSYLEEKSAVDGPIFAFKSPVSSLEPQSPFSRLGVQSPVAYVDPRALCSYCSCEDDFGCGYNCDKCTALCRDCNCETSLGCKYNCDKCEGNSTVTGATSGGGHYYQEDTQEIQEPNQQGTGDQGGAGAGDDNQGDEEYPAPPNPTSEQDCSALLNSQIALCMWGPSCPAVLASLFPGCNYNCDTCQLKSSEPCVAVSGAAAGQPCRFPFIYQGVKYNGCAPLHSGENGLEFWCSTNTDINGFHIRGPYPDIGKYVGFCDQSCPKDYFP